MINALAHHSKGKSNALFSSREHQDAQELFQLVSEAVKSEALAVHKEGLRDRGLGGLAPTRPTASSTAAAKDSEIYKGVFDGLTANRRSCMECGYTEAVMHFAFDNWQLSVPRQVRLWPYYLILSPLIEAAYAHVLSRYETIGGLSSGRLLGGLYST
jgi:ubiquitin carboxyl-terminal hydrolase 1